MLSRSDFLFAKIAEEAAEVSQAAIKCTLYGASHRYELYDSNNLQRMVDELADLHVTVAALLVELGKPQIELEALKAAHFAKLQVSWAVHQNLLKRGAPASQLKPI